MAVSFQCMTKFTTNKKKKDWIEAVIVSMTGFVPDMRGKAFSISSLSITGYVCFFFVDTLSQVKEITL